VSLLANGGARLAITAVLITREPEYPLDTQIDFPFDEVLLETNCPSLARRFELAAQARNEIIYVQDDDVAVDIAGLWRHYDGRLTNCMSWGHLQIYNGLCQNRVTLIGWGCFFPKRLLDFSPWTDAFGEMPAHEVDRIFTHLAFRSQGGPHNTVVMPFRQLPRAHAMSRDNPNHYTSRDQIIRQLDGML
jgi:hypothetical protein